MDDLEALPASMLCFENPLIKAEEEEEEEEEDRDTTIAPTEPTPTPGGREKVIPPLRWAPVRARLECLLCLGLAS